MEAIHGLSLKSNSVRRCVGLNALSAAMTLADGLEIISSRPQSRSGSSTMSKIEFWVGAILPVGTAIVFAYVYVKYGGSS